MLVVNLDKLILLSYLVVFMSFEKTCAEAIVKEITFQGRKTISKKRVSKGYRNKLLDDSIRKKRTKSEAKIISSLASIINVPQILSVNEHECEIIMEFVEGKVLKEIIEKKKELAILAGQEIKKIHQAGIIHGDLTTSNIIYKVNEKSKTNNKINNNGVGELWFIDFGLGFFSKKIEDVATDLIVFKKTFNATHSSLKNGWDLVLQGYNPSRALQERMSAIEKRARYH